MSRFASSHGPPPATAPKQCASNPLEADEGPLPIAAAAANGAMDVGVVVSEVALYEPVEVDHQRSGSPSNASTTSSNLSHSRTSTASSGWRRNNPYTLRRRSSNSDATSPTPISPRTMNNQRLERPAAEGGVRQLDVVRIALESSSGGSGSGSSLFGGLPAQQAFLFDPTHAVDPQDEHSSDGGIQRCRSSSWTSSSSTFDKASGNPLMDREAHARSSAWAYEQHAAATIDAPFRAPSRDDAMHRVAQPQQCSAVSGGPSKAPVSVLHAPTVAYNATAEPRATDSTALPQPIAVGGSMAHAVSPPLQVSPSERSPTHAASGQQGQQGQHRQPLPHKLYDSGHADTLPPGVVFSIYPPNNAQAQPQQTPSEKILRTSGASNVYQVLLKAHQLRDAKVQEALLTTGKVPTMPPVKQPHGLKPRHCAHFQFKRICNLGCDCNFIHSLVPYAQGSGSQGAGHVVGGAAAGPPHHHGAADGSRPTAYGALPPPPPPPPAGSQYTVHHHVHTPPPLMGQAAGPMHAGGYFARSPPVAHHPHHQPAQTFHYQQPQQPASYAGHPFAQNNSASYAVGGGGTSVDFFRNQHDTGGMGFPSGSQPPRSIPHTSPHPVAASSGHPSQPPYGLSQHGGHAVGGQPPFNYARTAAPVHPQHHQHHYYTGTQ